MVTLPKCPVPSSGRVLNPAILNLNAGFKTLPLEIPAFFEGIRNFENTFFNVPDTCAKGRKISAKHGTGFSLL